MAKRTLSVIEVLRSTAFALENRSDYQWGHMGSCNCGFLAQEITNLRKNEIHGYAMQRCGDWSEQLHDYCATSGLPMDDLITKMIEFGFDTVDLKHLERLSDHHVVKTLPREEQHLKHNVKADVVKYLKAWANVLEGRLVENIRLPFLESIPAEV